MIFSAVEARFGGRIQERLLFFNEPGERFRRKRLEKESVGCVENRLRRAAGADDV